MRKYASAEERATEKPENDRPPFWFYGESIQSSVHGSHIVIVEAPSYDICIYIEMLSWD